MQRFVIRHSLRNRSSSRRAVCWIRKRPWLNEGYRSHKTSLRWSLVSPLQRPYSVRRLPLIHQRLLRRPAGDPWRRTFSASVALTEAPAENELQSNGSPSTDEAPPPLQPANNKRRKSKQKVTWRTESPLRELNSWYFREHGIPRIVESIQTHKHVLEDGRTDFVYASLVCPVTQAQYFSGTLPNRKHHIVLTQQDKEDKGDRITAASQALPTIVAYKSTSAAQMAVAGRVLDILQYETTGRFRPRFCLEDPSDGKEALDTEEEGGGRGEEEELEQEAEKQQQNHGVVPKEIEALGDDLDLDNGVPPRGWPTALLNILYQVNHDIAVSDKVSVIVNEKTGYSTATFVCPLTAEKYTAGTFRGSRFGIPDDSNKGNGDGDDAVYYYRKSDAKAAVAARVLDLIEYKKTGRIEPRFCDEDPSKADNAVAIALLETKPKSKKSDVRVEDRTDEQPVSALNRHYMNEHKIDRVSDSIQSEWVPTGPGGWTASFLCPLTNAEYKAGTLSSRKNDILPFDGPTEGDRILYRNKSSARAAAAGRTMDVLHFQLTGSTHPRYCEDDPAEFAKSAGVEVKKQTLSSVLAEIEHNETVESDDDSDEAEETEMLTMKGLSLLPGHVDDDQSEEFVITQIDQGPSRRPFDRILEASASRFDSSDAHPVLPNMPREGTLMDDLVEARNAAFAQFKTMQRASSSKQLRSPHRFVVPRYEDASTLLVGKLLLERLAKAHQSLGRARQGNVSAEKAAGLILDFLWKTETCKPDADAYSYFLQCLEGPHPLQIAKRAESIVNNMKSGVVWKGNVLPKPNTRTINTLIQLQAQAGGRPMSVDDLEFDFEPNAETFMCLLSSSTYMPYNAEEGRPRFDIDLARRSIERALTIKGLSKSDLARACNAPLRWSGGHLARDSRPYARPTPFDDYGEIYKNGLIYEPVDKFVDEAKDYEKWADEIKHLASIETYEALIQCWLRTKTADGINKADEIASMLLTAPKLSGLRLPTLHPLLAAWLHSKHEDSVPKLLFWIEHLTTVSDEFPHLKPDGRMIGALISASAFKGENMLKNPKGQGLCQSNLAKDLVDMAHVCTMQLEAHCLRLESSLSSSEATDVFVCVSLFVDCLETWLNAVIANAEERTDGNVKVCLDGFSKVFSMFEKTVEAVFASEAGLLSKGNPSTQLLHILGEGDSFLLLVLRAFYKADIAIEKANYVDRGKMVAQNLKVIERTIRRVGEIYEARGRLSESVVIASPDKQEPTRLVYGDLFDYGKLQRGDPADKPRLKDVAIDVLERVPLDSDGNVGDIARIGLLVRGLCTAHRRHTETRGSVDKQFNRLYLSCQQAVSRISGKGSTDTAETNS